MKPTIKELSALVRHVKTYIEDDCRIDRLDDLPGIELTVACNDDMSEWTYQTGDNSYSGSCYFYPHWAVVGVYRRSNSVEVARDILSQLHELIPEDV